MPKLNEYITIGICSGYGDGDWRVSMDVQSLSYKQMQELIASTFHATRTAWELWQQAQVFEQAQAKQGSQGNDPITD